MQLVPGATQNSFEAVVEFLYDMVEGIVGKHMVGRVFSLLATLFIFILAANWFSILPGVGSIGWGHTDRARDSRWKCHFCGPQPRILI